MGALLSFLNASPARIQALLIGALAIAVLCLGLTGWALLERSWRFQAQDGRDRAIAQAEVLAAATKVCSDGVEQAKRAADGAIATTRSMLDEARRLHAGSRDMVRNVEELLTRKPPPGAGCEEAWREVEALYRQAGAPQ